MSQAEIYNKKYPDPVNLAVALRESNIPYKSDWEKGIVIWTFPDGSIIEIHREGGAKG